MIRIFGFIVAVGALVAGSVWMADHPGSVAVEWLAWRIDTSVPVLLLALLAILVLGWLAVRLLTGAWGVPGAFVRRGREKRRMKGLAALANAVIELAAGEPAKARRAIRDADKTLANGPLTHLLSAMADRAEGADANAEAHYRALLETPETELAGLRGLADLAARDAAAARPLVERAYGLAPDAVWTARALFGLQRRSGRLEDARETLKRAAKAPGFDADAERSTLLTQLAERARAEGRAGEAVKLAREAAEAAPGSEPAALALAAALAADGKAKKAAEVLESLWRTRPAPRIADAYLALWGDADAPARAKRIAELVAANPGHGESRLAVAEAAVAMADWDGARSALEPLAESGGSLGLRAALTRARVETLCGGGAEAAAPFLERAARLAAE